MCCCCLDDDVHFGPGWKIKIWYNMRPLTFYHRVWLKVNNFSWSLQEVTWQTGWRPVGLMSYILKSLCNNLYVKTQLHLTAQTSPPPTLAEKKRLDIHHTNTDRICMSWLISVVSDEMRPVPGVPLIESLWIFYKTAQLSHTLKPCVAAPPLSRCWSVST